MPKILRVALLAVILLASILLWHLRPDWARILFAPWIAMGVDHGWWVPAVGGGLLTAYLATLLWTLFGPSRHHHPEDAMALGCLSMASMGLAVVLAVLVVSVIFHWIFIVDSISFVTMILALFILPQAAWALWQDWRKKARTKERWIRPEHLAAHLSGKTHIIQRASSDPPRNWRELRYYAPDGNLAGYLEEDGKIRPLPAKVRWSVGPLGLITETADDPPKQFRYTTMQRRDGQVSYYFDDEGSPTHGWLAFRTVEIRDGEPTPSPEDPTQ